MTPRTETALLGAKTVSPPSVNGDGCPPAAGGMAPAGGRPWGGPAVAPARVHAVPGRPWWGVVCSLVWHGLVAGMLVALGTASGPGRPEAPPVLMDVVFGAPAGEGGSGDGSAGPAGPAGSAGDRAAALAPDEAVAKPEAPVVAPALAPPPQKPAKPPRRKPRPAPTLERSSMPAAVDRTPQPATAGTVTATGGGAGQGEASTGDALGRTGPGRGGPGDGAGAGGHGGGSYDGAFGAGGGPTFARQVRPEYPAQARRFGKEGVVVLRLCLDAAGNLTTAEVVTRAGAGFDEAALASVRASTYHPARLAGQPVPSRAVLRITFRLASR